MKIFHFLVSGQNRDCSKPWSRAPRFEAGICGTTSSFLHENTTVRLLKTIVEGLSPLIHPVSSRESVAAVAARAPPTPNKLRDQPSSPRSRVLRTSARSSGPKYLVKTQRYRLVLQKPTICPSPSPPPCLPGFKSPPLQSPISPLAK